MANTLCGKFSISLLSFKNSNTAENEFKIIAKTKYEHLGDLT